MTHGPDAPGSRGPPEEGRHGGISVVIPCYMQAHFLGDAIESALDQTLAPLDVVVVSDGSPDDTEAVAARYPEVLCIVQPNQGVSRARNRGMEESGGEYLVFLDADDRLLPNALQAGAESLERNPHCALTWGFNRPIDERGDVTGPTSNPVSGRVDYARLLERNVIGPPVGVMFRRHALEAIGGFRAVQSVEDYDVYLRLARENQLVCHHRVVAEYRYHGEKMSNRHGEMLSAGLEILDREAEHVAGDPALVAAIERGRRHFRMMYEIEPRIENVADDVRAGRWFRAARGAATVLTRNPGALLGRARSWIGSRLTRGRPRAG